MVFGRRRRRDGIGGRRHFGGKKKKNLFFASSRRILVRVLLLLLFAAVDVSFLDGSALQDYARFFFLAFFRFKVNFFGMLVCDFV